MLKCEYYEIAAVLCFGFAWRSIVSLHSYSGQGKPPMHGDYEAQRHWQEVTVNLPAADWYRNTSDNDLLYWGLDYPPLTAYHSYAVGLVAQRKDPSFVALHESRGYESAEHKRFMRHTVFLADLVVLLPSVLVLVNALKHHEKTRKSLLPMLLVFMLYPGQILIDNGHFQYNNISLGLFLLAVAAVLRDNLYGAALWFSLALNYKQMELYHSLPFFVYLLRKCLQQKGVVRILKKFSVIGGIVLLTFGVLWLPWLRSVDSALQLVNRLFPIGRGVFEDKVSNVWCAVNVVYKLKQSMTNSQMALMCLLTTLFAVLPINGNLLARPRKEKFLFCLANTAMSFFLFSFQVHEKSILLVAFPAIILFDFQPLLIFTFLEVTTFSMLPLLLKDQLTLAFFAVSLVFHVCVKKIYIDKYCKRTRINMLASLTTLLLIAVSLGAIFVPAPLRYPDLWSLLISVISCGYFGLYLANGLYAQYTL